MPADRATPLSVLDNVPVWSDSTATEALRYTLRLAAEVERLGYTRYWISEHHNMRRLATTAPAVLIGQIAAATSGMRVGSGGVLLPNHPPLVIAEQFGTLEALHPGRIDLGIGRSVGTDQATARRLRGDGLTPDPEVFAASLAELDGYFADAEHPEPVVAVPADEHRPAIWLLGSSIGSAAAAGRLGLPYAFAHQLNPADSAQALQEYRDGFKPSRHLDRPYGMLSAFVFAADTDEQAERLARPVQLGYIRVLTTKRTDPYPGRAETEAHAWTAQERESVRGHFEPQIIGSPEAVRQKARALIEATGADELMSVTLVQDFAERLHSYELVRRQLGAPDTARSGPARAAGAA